MFIMQNIVLYEIKFLFIEEKQSVSTGFPGDLSSGAVYDWLYVFVIGRPL